MMNNSRSAFENYIRLYPGSIHKTEALLKIDSIDWSIATKADNPDAYSKYAMQHPDGEYIDEAKGKMENAGIFCHNNPWVIIGETVARRGNDAWEHYTKIAPAWIRDQQLHKVEPYVYCQMVAGKDAARPGEGKVQQWKYF